MNTGDKRKYTQQDDNRPKRVKKECTYGEKCYRKNPAHFREFSHAHLEAILDTYSGTGPYPIPNKYSMERVSIEEQLDVIVQKQFYTPWFKELPSQNRSDQGGSSSAPSQLPTPPETNPQNSTTKITTSAPDIPKNPPLRGILKNSSSRVSFSTPEGSNSSLQGSQNASTPQGSQNSSTPRGSQNPKPPQGSQTTKTVQRSQKDSQPSLYPLFNQFKSPTKQGATREPLNPQGATREPLNPQGATKEPLNPQGATREPLNPQGLENASNRKNGEGSSTTTVDGQTSSSRNNSDYRPIVAPLRRAEDYLSVVPRAGQMATKHAASAPYHIFYTTITAAKETHHQRYSITFQEILDRSLGELKCSLQINFMVELGWLLAQYYFAGYSMKRLTILYGDESPDLQTISQKKPNVDAHKVHMASPFGTHHTKMMILCYEDGSLRVVVSTANLYLDDWENRVQGLWFSPRCPELPPTSMPHDGDSPTAFKKSLLRYLNNYHSPALTFYIDRVKRCDFSHINVFLVASVPGGHFDTEWGLTRTGSLLRQHCAIPPTESKNWPLIAQASSLGSFGKDPSVWLAGDFLHNFSKIKLQPQTLSPLPALKLIYPSLENVQRSHDSLLGGGCLPYAASVHSKQPWLNQYLHQWKATSTNRDRAMPHIKSYTRLSPDCTRAAYFLLTSGNCSKAAWGSINKGNGALRVMSYEAGVLFIPKIIINEDLFPLEESARNRLVLPYDVPPVKYAVDMSPWVSDYLMR